jgi:hypothetical protein
MVSRITWKEIIMTNQTALSGRKPTHRIYRVIGEGKSANWAPIGAAWPNQDGMGYSISCDAIPLTGRIVMRVITERTMTGGAQ